MNGVRPANKDAAARMARSVHQATPAADPSSKGLILRSAQPPASQLDYDDRHDTRATESDDMARRYAALRKDRRKSDWQQLAMGLAAFVAGVAAYLVGFIVVSRLLPELSPRQAAQVVGLAFATAGGSVAAGAAGRALTARFRNRGRDSRSA